MTDEAKTKGQLIEELINLRARISALENSVYSFSCADDSPQLPPGIGRCLIRSIPVPVFYKDKQGRYLGCNPAFEHFFGTSQERIAGKTVYDLASGHLAETYYQMDLALIEKPGIQIYESEVIDALGRTHQVIFHKATFNAPDGSIGGLVGAITDITEQRRMETALKETRDVSQKYLDIAAVIFLVIDASQNVVLINNKGCEVLGRRESEILGRNWFDVAIEASSREQLKSAFNLLMSGKGEMVEYVENTVITQTGEKRIIAWHNAALTDETGRITGVLSSGQDVTEHYRADQALRESEARLHAILDSLQSGILIIDPQSRTIVDANPMAARLIGALREELIGAICHKYVCPAEKGKCPITDLGQDIDDSERVLICSDGRQLPLLKTVSTVMLNGRPHLVEQFVDISERKKMEESLARALKVKTAMTELSRSLLSSSSIEQISSLVLEHARSLTGSTEGFVGYMDPKAGCLVDGTLPQDPAAVRENRRPVMGRFGAFYGRAIESGKTILQNVPIDGERRTEADTAGLRIDRFLSAPAVFEGVMVGHIALVNSEHDYLEEDLEVVGRMADLYAIAVSRMRLQEELHRISITDQLTGLKNRRGFLSLAEQQLKLAKRTKKGMMLSFLDLDGLKRINDKMGHEQGDQAIIETARILQDSFRESDIIARLGGDEFAVLAVDISGADPQILAARLAHHMQEHNRMANRPYQLSISTGTAFYDPENPRSLDELMAEADQLMYRQKRGKDKEFRP